MASLSRQSFFRHPLAALAAALFGAIGAAFAGSVPLTLVDNLEGPVSSVRVSTQRDVAQPFMTGEGAHLLESVTLKLGFVVLGTQAEVLVKLDSGGLPGVTVGTLNQQVIQAGPLADYVFTPQYGDVRLEPDTKYWIVARNINGAFDWATRAASADGILDEEATSDNFGVSWSDTNVPNRYLQMRVNGCYVPHLSVANAQATEPGSGTSQMNFTVTLDGPPGQDSTVLVTTFAGTASSGADYVAQTAQPVVFSAGGSTTRTVSVTINDDSLVEDNETFTISLTAANPDNLIIDDGMATGTIVDDDALLFDMFEDGNDNGWTHYNPLGSAVFSFPAGRYRLQAGASPNPGLQRPGRAAALRLDLFEADFVLGVEVSSWDAALDLGFGLMARASGFGDNRPEGYGFLYLPSVAQARIVRFDDEGAATIGSFDVFPAPGADEPLWFTFSGSGSAMEGNLYRKSNLVAPIATVTAVDSRYSGGISGIYASSRPPNGATAVDVTFDNFLHSTSLPPLLAVGADAADRAEGAGAATHSFEITRGGSIDNAITVDWAVAGTGDHPADAADFGGTLPSGTVSFAVNQAAKSVSIPVVGDGTVEPDETYEVRIVGATGRAVNLNGVAAGAIRNDDAATFEIGFGSNKLQVYEGRDGIRTAVTALRLSAPVDRDIEVTISTGDFTATAADGDYVPFSGRVVNIPAGAVLQPVAVSINGDAASEAAFEVFQVRVVGFDAHGRAVSPVVDPQFPELLPVTSISILNDDVALALSGGPAELTEGGATQPGQFGYTVTLSSALTEAVNLDWSIQGTGVNPVDAADFPAASGTLTIPANTTIASLPIPVTGDHDLEPRETFELTVAGQGATATQDVGAAPVSDPRIARHGATPTATLGASGGTDGSGRILLPDGAAASDGQLVILATFGPAGIPTTLLRHLQDGSAIAGYESYVSSGQLVERARFVIDSSKGVPGAFNGSASVPVSSVRDRVYLFVYNATSIDAATAGGVFGSIDPWQMPVTGGQSVSLDARLAGESYWGQLVVSTAVPGAVDLRMAPLPGQPGLLQLGSATVSGAILNDDEILGIGAPVGDMVTLQHTGRPNSSYAVDFSDDLIGWAQLEVITTDAQGLGAYTEPRIFKLARRFYRFRLISN